MSEQVEFFYDYVSIYSYLADSQLQNLASAEIVYRPMFLGGVMEATGNRPPGTVEAKRNYMLTDIERWAIQETLRLTSGNREEAARTLKIGARTLYRKLKEFGGGD